MGADSRNNTNVYRLDLGDYKIERLETSGARPTGGMTKHVAEIEGAGEEAMIKVRRLTKTKKKKKNQKKKRKIIFLRIRDLTWLE